LEEQGGGGLRLVASLNSEKRFQQLRGAGEMAVGLHFLFASLAIDTG
jgi:hypothetical protein